MSKLLIIDDEKSIRITLTEVLSYENYEVESAVNGMEGLEKFKKDKFDVVLCDVKMPEMDGIEVLEEILKIDPQIPVVMITGHGNVENAVKAIKLGAFDYIEKPLDLNVLLVTIQNAIELCHKEKIIFRSGFKEYLTDSEVENTVLKNVVNEVDVIYDEEGNEKSVVLPIRLWNFLAEKIGLKHKEQS